MQVIHVSIRRHGRGRVGRYCPLPAIEEGMVGSSMGGLRRGKSNGRDVLISSPKLSKDTEQRAGRRWEARELQRDRATVYFEHSVTCQRSVRRLSSPHNCSTTEIILVTDISISLFVDSAALFIIDAAQKITS